MLKLTVKVGEEIWLGPDTKIKVFDRKGRAVSLGFETPISPITVERVSEQGAREIEMFSPGFEEATPES